MTTNPEREFDTWLDAYVAGMSTPASRAAANTNTDDARTAARQFHGLARRADERAGLDPSIAPTWEDFMQTHALTALSRRGASNRTTPPPDTASSNPGLRGTLSAPGATSPPWHVALNVALAVILVATLGLGIWRATDGFQGIGNGGDDPGPGGNTAFAPETRVFTPVADEATPEDLPVVPTAAECTVEPLTIDQVLWYVEDPGAAARFRDPDDASTPVAETEPGSLTNDQVLATANASAPGPASPDQLAAMAAVQRMWMACVLADSPFQRWALESPELVAWEAGAMFPNFVSRDEARAILEEVERTGMIEPHEDFWKRDASFQMISSTAPPWGYLSSGDGTMVYPVAVLDPDPLHSWTTDGRTFAVPYIILLPDGTPLNEGQGDSSGIPISEVAANSTEILDTCSIFEFTWYPERDLLVVSDIPSCG